jgi:hypothetical protein
MNATRTPTVYVVPAGTRAAKCRGPNCAKPIYFVRNSLGGMTPIDCDVPGGKRPSEHKDTKQLDAFSGSVEVYDGNGISHFNTCVDAGLFTRSNS